MTQNAKYGVDQTGINLIRIVIGSYFMALSLDLVVGVDTAMIFAPFLGSKGAEIAGAMLLFLFSAGFMAGVYLRLAALCLGLLVFTSSLLENMIHPGPESLSAFWRDLALTASVLLSYLSLNAHALRRASVLAHRARQRRLMMLKAIEPRRVDRAQDPKRPVQEDIRRALKSADVARRPRVGPDEPDTVNIFASL